MGAGALPCLEEASGEGGMRLLAGTQRGESLLDVARKPGARSTEHLVGNLRGTRCVNRGEQCRERIMALTVALQVKVVERSKIILGKRGRRNCRSTPEAKAAAGATKQDDVGVDNLSRGRHVISTPRAKRAHAWRGTPGSREGGGRVFDLHAYDAEAVLDTAVD